MVQNGEHKATCNGVVKGRPGKGRVLSLGQRARCYNKPPHCMTEDNTFRYTPKPTKATPKPLERQWCKACRALSRKRSQVKLLAAAKAIATAKRKADKAALATAMPTATAKVKASTTARLAVGATASLTPRPRRRRNPMPSKTKGKVKASPKRGKRKSTRHATTANALAGAIGRQRAKSGKAKTPKPTAARKAA